MTSVDDLLSQIPLAELAGQLGVSEADAEQAVRQVVPALLGGMEANAQDPGGAASLAAALGQHTGGPQGLGAVDTADGAKIVSHIFGAEEGAVVDRLGGSDGAGGSGLVAKLLPILAPIVMRYLAERFLGGGSTSTGSSRGSEGGGGLADILGGILGGGSGGGAGGLGGSGGLGDILGDILGGGTK